MSIRPDVIWIPGLLEPVRSFGGVGFHGWDPARGVDWRLRIVGDRFQRARMLKLGRLWWVLLFGGSLTLPGAASVFWVLDGLGGIRQVDPNLNLSPGIALGNPAAQGNSLAIDPQGNLYVAEATGGSVPPSPPGFLFQVTATSVIPVGSIGYTLIGDLDHSGTGLWGFSNASQSLFFFDLGSLSVTYATSLPALVAHTITGVAYQTASGSVFLSGNTGANQDELFRVDLTPTPNLSLVGSIAHTDGASHVSDIDFDAGGGLYGITWFHRHVLSINPTTAATVTLSVGPHQDASGLAIQEVPEVETMLPMAVTALVGVGMLIRGWKLDHPRANRAAARSE